MRYIPRPETLRKYGLTLEDFNELYTLQGGKCAICEKPFTKTICIDHNHVRNWKHMTPENRKRHVRGLLCFFCNKYYVGRSITVRKARNVVTYLEKHEARIANG